MRIETKYSLGDRVWKISQDRLKVWERCTFCDGFESPKSAFADVAKIVGCDGKKRRCPKCFGDGGHHRSQKLAWGISGELTIGLVEYRFRKEETREAYMCIETGVGGGTIHYVDSLYPSEKEAQVECEERNKDE